MTATTGRPVGRFAEFVRKRREDLGMTIVEMSDRSGVPQNYISQIENGRISFPRRYLSNFAEALGLSETDLLRANGILTDAGGAEPSDPGEAAMLMRWRELDETNQKALEAIAAVLARTQAEGSR